jgi:hypothetical protein
MKSTPQSSLPVLETRAPRSPSQRAASSHPPLPHATSSHPPSDAAFLAHELGSVIDGLERVDRLSAFDLSLIQHSVFRLNQLINKEHHS